MNQDQAFNFATAITASAVSGGHICAVKEITRYFEAIYKEALNTDLPLKESSIDNLTVI